MNFFSRAAAVLALSCLSAGTALPALAAWQTEEQKGDTFRQTRAGVSSADGVHFLEVGCYLEADDIVGELYVTLYSGENYDEDATYAEWLTMTVRSGSEAIDLAYTIPTQYDGELIFDASELDDELVWDALVVLEEARNAIEIRLGSASVVFPHDNAAQTIGAILDIC